MSKNDQKQSLEAALRREYRELAARPTEEIGGLSVKTSYYRDFTCFVDPDELTI